MSEQVSNMFHQILLRSTYMQAFHCMQARSIRFTCVLHASWASMYGHVPSSTTPIHTREQHCRKGKQKLLLRYVREWTAGCGVRKESRRRAWRSGSAWAQDWNSSPSTQVSSGFISRVTVGIDFPLLINTSPHMLICWCVMSFNANETLIETGLRLVSMHVSWECHAY